MRPTYERRTCSHCGRRRMACMWSLQACADGRKKRELWLCFPCDKELNGSVLRFFRVDDWRIKLAAYRW